MKLYHGSTVIVDKPLVSYGRNNLDFGKGFYTTNMQSQAEKWVQRFISLGKKGIINIYNFDDTDIQKNTAIRNCKNTMKNGLISFLPVAADQKNIRITTSSKVV